MSRVIKIITSGRLHPMDFALYLGAINAGLLAKGRPKADQGRARKYFLDGISVADAQKRESDAQGQHCANDPADPAHNDVLQPKFK